MKLYNNDIYDEMDDEMNEVSIFLNTTFDHWDWRPGVEQFNIKVIRYKCFYIEFKNDHDAVMFKVAFPEWKSNDEMVVFYENRSGGSIEDLATMGLPSFYW